MTYCQTLYGAQPGWVAQMFCHNGRMESDTYRFGRVKHHYSLWPDDADSLVRELVDAAEHVDVYVIPLLRSKQNARKGSGIPGRYLFADCDPGSKPRTAAAEMVLQQVVGVRDCLTVESGRPGHEHVYIPLTEPQTDLERWETWNHRLAVSIGADDKWADNSFLRLPGTLNHKGRALGGASMPVMLR